MKKTKKLLSLLTALTITASAFASFIIPASAAETTLYTADFSGVTDGQITKKATSADDLTKCNVEDFGTGNAASGYEVAAIPALDGWGYMHYGYSTALTDNRQSSASVTGATNTISVYTPGNDKANGAISFIPANVEGLTVPATGYLVYEFSGELKSTKGKDIPVGFTKGTGSEVSDAGKCTVKVAGGETKSLQFTMVHNVATGDYAIYADGIQKATGQANGITGIYGQGVSNDGTTVSISNLTLKSTDTAPEAVEYSFIGDGQTELDKGTALVGATLTAPAAPDVQGKTFKGWKDAADNIVTEFTVGSEKTVYTAVYEAAAVANIIIKTNAYSKVTLMPDSGDVQTVYTDAAGSATVVNAAYGNYSYKIEKQGYITKEGTMTLAAGGTTIEETLNFVENPDIEYIYYEADFENGSGKLGLEQADRVKEISIQPIDMPSLATISLSFDTSKAEEGQITWQLLNESGKVVVGLQMVNGDDGGIYAFTGWSGNKDLNQSGDVGKYTEGVKIADSYIGEKTVEIVIDQTTKAITAKCGDVSKSLTLIEDASKIVKVKAGKYRLYTSSYITNINAYRPNPNFVLVSGDTEFAKIKGRTVTREYKYAPAVMVPDEVYEWSVANESGEAVSGVTIDENGVLSITDAVPAGKLIIKVVSSANADKKGELEVNVHDFSTNLTPIVEVPAVMEPDTTQHLRVTRITDEYDDDVTEYFSPVWSIENTPSLDTEVTFDTTEKTGDAVAISTVKEEGVLKSISKQPVTITGNSTVVTAEGGSTVMLWDSLEGMKPIAAPQTAQEVTMGEDVVAAVGAKSGKLNAYNEGSVEVMLTLTDSVTKNYRVDIAAFSKVVDFTAGMTEIDISDIVNEDIDEAITGYQVTLASESGALLAQEVKQAADYKVAIPELTADVVPAKVEVAPVYEATSDIASADDRCTFNVPTGTYDISVTASGSRFDLYVNNQLVVNNMLQYASKPPYTDIMHDVVVSEGYANMNTRDYVKGKSAADSTISKLTLVKSPSIVTRTPKIYVMGDSLVANYYEDADTMTGWGQVLKNYIADDMEVVNIANSGADSIGIADTQLTRILGSAQAGDYMVLESGYNDKGHKIGEDKLKDRVRYMTNAARAKGVNVVLVSPNASAHDYSESVAWTSTMTEAANELRADYINLSKLSYDFLFAKYGAGFTSNDALKGKYNIVRTNENYLHSTVNAANCWAAIVASELGKLGVETTDYEYTFNDGTDDITVSVETMTN